MSKVIDSISAAARVILCGMCKDVRVGFALVLVDLDHEGIPKNIHVLSNGDGPEEAAKMLYSGADEVALRVGER